MLGSTANMETGTTRSLIGLGLIAGLMIGTGHIGGGLAVAVAAGAAAWLARAEAFEGDPG